MLTMAENSTTNTMEVETPGEEIGTEEYHDAETVHGGIGPNINGDVKTEIHILVEITFRGSEEAKTTPQKHMQLLNALGRSFNKTELKMLNMKNRKVLRESTEQWRDITTYSDNFKIHDARNRHYVVFRAMTTKTFGELKRAPEVWQLLNKTGCYMKKHHWSIDEWDITTLGFLIEIDPSRHQSDEVREYVIGLSKQVGCYKEQGCNFKLVPERFKVRNNDAHFATYAYAVQCPRSDAKAVDTLLKSTFRDEGQSYVKLKLKKSHPKSYANAMTLQNCYLSEVRTVSIVGITRSSMTILKQQLMESDRISYIASTSKTDTIGRWDIITMSEWQDELKAWLMKHFDQWISNLPEESVDDRPANFPAPSIQAGTSRADEDSSGGDVSYLSNSAGSYDSATNTYDDQDNYHDPPGSGIISGMTWAQTVARNPQTASTASSRPESGVSALTGPTTAQQNKRYDDMEQRLTGELTAIREDMRKLLERMERRDSIAEQGAITAAAAIRTAAPPPPNREQQYPQPPFQYPPFGVNGYNPNYHPPATPDFNFQMYQGYPNQAPYHPPQQWNQQQRQIMDNRAPISGMQGEEMQEDRQRHDESERPHDRNAAVGPRDLNKRSHNSPSFADQTADRTKRLDKRATPSKEDPMEEQEPPPDTTGQRKQLLPNPYSRRPRTPTRVPPPNHIHQGLYPLEWNKGRSEQRRHHPLSAPIPGEYARPPEQPQQGSRFYQPDESHPAEDARHFSV